MQLFPLNFFICTVSGIWRPIEWSSNCAKLLYNLYTLCMLLPLYFLMLTQLMDLILIVDNVNDFTDNSLVFITIVAVGCKATIAMMRRDAIIDLVQTLLQEPCKPRNAEEAAIQTKFDEFIRSCTIKYLILGSSTCTSMNIRSVVNAIQGILPYRVWLPYDLNSSLPFWITALLQVMTTFVGSFIDIGIETLIFGLLLQTCAQLEIFEWRLNKYVINRSAATLIDGQGRDSSASYNEELLSIYILHHLNIYEYARTVNSVFTHILFVQFFGSVLILCTSVYYLSSHITETEAVNMTIYITCMCVQIFVYCWSGNEVIEKSANIGDAVYHTDWTLLSVNEKKDLLMIMKRSTIPIKFTSSFLVTLSLQSFGNILKTSYSAFNVLQQS